MTSAEQTLVIILSSFLAIFLILAITVAILAIKLLNKLRGIADNAESITANIEAASDSFRSAAGPLAFSKIIGSIYGMYRGVKGKGKWR